MQDTNLGHRRAAAEDPIGGVTRRGAGDNGVPASTPTGIAITLCGTCGVSHPVTRSHCVVCGSASLFIHAGRCLAHAWPLAA
jgi:hypothetical protein